MARSCRLSAGSTRSTSRTATRSLCRPSGRSTRRSSRHAWATGACAAWDVDPLRRQLANTNATREPTPSGTDTRVDRPSSRHARTAGACAARHVDPPGRRHVAVHRRDRLGEPTPRAVNSRPPTPAPPVCRLRRTPTRATERVAHRVSRLRRRSTRAGAQADRPVSTCGVDLGRVWLGGGRVGVLGVPRGWWAVRGL